MNIQYNGIRKLVFLLCVAFSLTAGCVNMPSAHDQAFLEAVKTFDANNKTSPVADDLYFNELFRIALQYNEQQNADVYQMLRNEAFLKKTGQPNNYDNYKARWGQGDQSLFGDAFAYKMNLEAQSQCFKFGFKGGTPEFNKCVYDTKMQMAQLKMQIDQNMMNTIPPPTFTLPTPKPTYHTTCRTDDETTRCVTQ